MIPSCDGNEAETTTTAPIGENTGSSSTIPESDSNDEENSPTAVKMSEEEWNSIFDAIQASSNMTFTALVTTCEPNGKAGTEISNTKVEIAGNTTHEIVTEGGISEYYYAIENSEIYRYENQSGVWVKQRVNNTSIPVTVMLNNLLRFKDMYSDMTYDSKNNVYTCENMVQNDPFIGSYTIYEIKITFVGGKISRLYYVSDTFINSSEPTRCAFTYDFSNYGTTTVVLPTV
jgi:hypothetical protein